MVADNDFIFKLKENKQFVCILFFLFYLFGLIKFYFSNTILFCISLFILFIFVLCFFFNKKIQHKSFLIFIFSLVLFYSFGFLNAKTRYVEIDDFSNIQFMQNVYIEGYITSIPKFNPKSNIYKFFLSVKRAKINNIDYRIKSANFMVSLKNTDITTIDSVKFGDYISLNGILSTPSGATNPSQFDYKKFLNNKGVLKTFYSKSQNFNLLFKPNYTDLKDYSLVDKKELFYLTVVRKMHDIRDMALLKHSNYIQSPNLEILGGVVFGDDAVNPPDDIKDSFINSGLLHLLAASGLNVALILSMWLCFVYFINIPYRIKITSGILVMFLYTLMTGFPPSIVRASVMLLLILFGKLIYREANGISLILVAGFLILLFKPEFLLDVGFQLSFLVTLGLIVCIPSVTYHLKKINKVYLKKIKKLAKPIKSFLLIFSPISLTCCFLVPFIAQIWASPLQAYYFNTFSTYSIFANIAVVPFIGIVSFIGFISTVFCFIPYLSDILLPFFDFVLNFIIEIILFISNYFSSLDNSILKVPSFSFLNIIFYYLFVILFFNSIKFAFKKKILNYLLLVILLLFVTSFIRIDKNNFEILFFNVGNGDNCLIKTNDNKYIMIDTGKFVYTGLSTAKSITLEYLYDNNIKELEVLIISHYDADHSGGLIDILENVRVKNLIIPKLECTSKNTCEIKNYIEANKIEYQTPYLNQSIKINDKTEIINFISDIKKKNSRNESSVVTLLKYDKFKVLFMGDATIETFNRLKKYLSLDVDILKASHHGAKNTVDNQILDVIKPEFTVILTGPNVYGHPDSETVDLFARYSKVLSTDKLGAIKFVIDKTINLQHFDSKQNKFIKID